MLQAQFTSRFLHDRDESGRYIIKSLRTGRSYFIEPIGPDRTADWGSYNPSTGNIENKKGSGKFRGSINDSDSLITEENGFTKIHYTGVGESPESVIESLDAKYPTI